ncbi:MAG TPA: FtsX-like permease family protein [Thermoanaerobaculia bacterium]|nr:FtsX-like permease family protein [Thermoanaerobaculia bacterium]
MLLRGLTHFWRANLAVALGAAVASTVLTGALLAGDSVRGSLIDLTLDRLGGIDAALVAEGFFRERLGEEAPLSRRKGGDGRGDGGEEWRGIAPLIVAQASAVHGSSGMRAARIAVYGVDERFTRLHGRGGDISLESPPEGFFPPAIVNESLAAEVGAKAGDDLLLSFELPGEIPRETLLGDKDAEDALVSRRFTVARVIPDRGLGGFSLAPHQARPRNAFVSLAALQEILAQEGKANALLAALPSPPSPLPPPQPPRRERGAPTPPRIPVPPSPREGVGEGGEGGQGGEGFIDLRPFLRLEDLGLRIARGPGHISLESEGFFLKPAAVEVAQRLGPRPRRVFTYLATGIRANGRLLPYSMVAGLSASSLADGQIRLNQWAAKDLGVSPGDAVELSYLVMAPAGGLREERTVLRLAGVVGMSGLGADRSLTPTFPGIENAEDIAAWDPPFPVDLSVIRPRDEEYWDEHGAAPKAFVSLATAQRLWSTRFGDLTALRFEAGAAELGRIEAALRRELPSRVDLAPFGLVFHPVKRQGLAAARGSTDFAGLFLAFSFFLIVSAVLLVGLLFSLAVERRAGELGMLLAVGYPVRAVRRRLLAEGAVLAGAGALLGLGGACGYAWLLMAGLRTWWLPAVGTSDLYLHVEPSSLAVGWIASVIAVLVAIFWTVRRLARVPAPALLAGSTVAPGGAGAGRLARPLALGGAAVALVLMLTMALTGETSSPALAFGAGASLLISGLAGVSLWLRRPRPARRLTLLGMAARNGAASPGRSLLSVALVAAACFVLVTVAANRRSETEEETPGAGGFPLFAESAVPLAADLNTSEGRFALGLPEDEALAGVAIHPLRLVPGDDASCLNLFRPERPRLLGVPPRLFANRFRFQRTLETGGDPWALLDRDFGPGVIPVIADESSATWILKLGLGEDLSMTDEAGEPVRLRLVALLDHSLFQSELLVSEKNLLRYFPRRAGRSFFLIDAPRERAPQISQALEEGLGRYGFDVSSTAARLAAYQAVEATYLQTFAALGGFGLLLGTLGLGIALLRGVIERRGELATLRAFGFRRRRIAWMVTAENGFLLLLGVALGSVAGLLAVAPRLAEGGSAIPWTPLVSTLLAVLALGFAASLAAVWSALQAPLLPVLKEER